MYIIIGGGGQVGYYLAKGLITQGHEVLLLEKDPVRFERLKKDLGTSVLKGDACEARTLDEIGTERANLVIAVTGDDDDNLVICQVAKTRYHVAFTVARVNNPGNEQLFRDLGIDMLVSPTAAILHMIEAEIPHHSLVPLLTLTRAGMSLVELTVPPDSEASGRTIKSLNLPSTVNVVLVVRGDENLTPSGEFVLQPEDRVFTLVSGQGERALEAIVLGEQK
ncbi:MAG TPA: TrkA family potassium uptake protein [Ktedonobacterales bacterium]